MGKLKEAIRAQGQRGSRCAVGDLIDVQTAVDAKDLTDILADRTYTSAQIHRGMVAENMRVSVTTLKAHRKGECACV